MCQTISSLDLQEGGLHFVYPIDPQGGNWLELQWLEAMVGKAFPQELLKKIGFDVADNVLSSDGPNDVTGALVKLTE